MIPKWGLLLGGVALCAGIWLHGNWHGSKVTAATYKAQIAEANVKALEERTLLQEITNELVKKYWTDIDAVNDKLADALVRLYDREARLSEASRTKCKGSTGAELSREDAEFLTREAARGDEYAIALQACYDYADSLQE
jgi:hypothetical protein